MDDEDAARFIHHRLFLCLDRVEWRDVPGLRVCVCVCVRKRGLDYMMFQNMFLVLQMENSRLVKTSQDSV